MASLRGRPRSGWPGDIVGISLLGVLLYHTLRQLRAVARTQAAASSIDLFQPAPLYAFSPVTAQTGIGLLAIPAYGLVTDPRGWSSAESFVVIGVVMVVATVAFLLPLVGMNRRIRLEQDRLQADVGSRLQHALADLHDRIDARDDTGVSNADRTVLALGREWELLDRLPTWPWRGTTLGAFASAMMVPIILWMIQRLLEHVV
jgi:uncharacterized membrane protein